jgi:hypothetical protein
MPGGKPYTPPKSKAQARLFGAAAAGQIPGFSPSEARNKLRGTREKSLPERVGKGQATSRTRRVAARPVAVRVVTMRIAKPRAVPRRKA